MGSVQQKIKYTYYVKNEPEFLEHFSKNKYCKKRVPVVFFQ
jgi:hypothetical protein